MDKSKNIPAWIGIACTWVGAAVGVFAVTAMAAGLKAVISPDAHVIKLFDGVLGIASIVAALVSAGLMFSGAWLGRRRKREIAQQQSIGSARYGMPEDWSEQRDTVWDRDQHQ